MSTAAQQRANETFAAILNFIIDVETMQGKRVFTNDPQDPGGRTKYGISQRAFPDLDIASLTLDEARELYRVHYWALIQGDKLPRKTAMVMMDGAINQGVSTAIKLMQISIGAVVDGIIGPETIRRIQFTDPAELVPEFLAQRGFHYALNPAVHRDGLGWMRRLFNLQAFVGKA